MTFQTASLLCNHQPLSRFGWLFIWLAPVSKWRQRPDDGHFLKRLNGNFSSDLLPPTKRVTLSRMRSKNSSKPAKSAKSYPKGALSAKRLEKVNPSLIKGGKK